MCSGESGVFGARDGASGGSDVEFHNTAVGGLSWLRVQGREDRTWREVGAMG